MIHDYQHAAILQERHDALRFGRDVTTSAETEHLFALKVVLDACGFDGDEVVGDSLTDAIRDDMSDAGIGIYSDDVEDSIRAELRRDITFERAVKMLPDMAAAWKRRQAEYVAAANERAAKNAVLAFILSLRLSA